MRRTPIPLRVYLLLLVLGAMLPGAVLTAILVAQTFAGNRAVVERRLMDAARVDAAAVDRELDAAIAALQVLATSPALAADNLRAFHDEAARLQRGYPGWYTVLLLSTEGKQLMSTRLQWGTPLPAPFEPASVLETVRHKTATVGVLATGPPSGLGRRFAVRVPVMRDGEARYVLSAVIEASSLQQVVSSSLPVAEEWTRALLDSSATVVARSRDPERFVGQPASERFRERITSGATGVFPETSFDGTPVYATIGRGKYGWIATIVVPRPVLDAPVRGSGFALIVGGAFLMIGTLAALLLVSRRLSRDLVAVASTAEAVAEGRPIAEARAHVAETSRLQESLRAAARLLERRQHERDQEVERAQAARREAEHANQTKDQFLAVLGHELRNPLAPAMTALELMKLREPDVFERERQVLERQVGHMVRLVDDLLDVASLERGKVALSKRRFELREAVDRAVDMARPLLDRQHHGLRVGVPQSGMPIDGDEDRIVQVLANLLTNAAKYTPERGQITLSAIAEGGTAVIACEDDGPGIPEEVRATLFAPFAQGPRTLDRAQGGLGLGLALARTLTTLHGGTIELETPASGHGSRFVVRIPLATGEPVPAAESTPVGGHAKGGGRRVLVVDDNADACEMLRALIERAGHYVSIALDGPSALRAASTFDPQVGILDIGLPGMDGYELARRLRQSHPLIHLIAVTGYGQPSDTQAAERAGFDRHCTKPVDFATLLEQIDAGDRS
ncbi:MAG TPA: ATP-binding protein [Vicinamibacterales bacterium]|nr:ATP-binding protein [Vicinamibacterales bacterium]